MALLPAILSSRVRAEILPLLFGVSPQDLHLREIARRSGFALATVQQELAKLERMGLVVIGDGNDLARQD